MIQERVHAGLARARARVEGKVMGRPTAGSARASRPGPLSWGSRTTPGCAAKRHSTTNIVYRQACGNTLSSVEPIEAGRVVSICWENNIEPSAVVKTLWLENAKSTRGAKV
jgi:hypothetical protein